MKKLTYNFINPNTDEELAKHVSAVLSKAIADKLVYSDALDVAAMAAAKRERPKSPAKIAAGG